MKEIKHKLKYGLKNLLQWTLVIFFTSSLAIILRVFVFAKFSIPTPSMEPSIKAGEQVLVSKLTPGARIITNFFTLKKGEVPEVKRMPGFSVKRNEVLIFNFPYSDWQRMSIDMNVFYAKRCVAIPGDTFYIENGIYKVTQSSDTLGCYKNQQYLAERKDNDFNSDIYNCFPFDTRYSWNIKNFGPLYVPRKNETLLIDTLNIILYKKLIEFESRKTIKTKAMHVLMGDSTIQKYTFTKNYYFMAGDFVFDSQDSRYWGLLSEDHIVGKVAFVWNIKDISTGKTKWSDFLKKIK
ncbi:MAG: signal peptidase I [Bacteroides sp.]|nr:signal peptidase I [Bacteroides sp.]